jgi:hypothetical protein
MELGYEEGNASAVRELSFSVGQNADQLVSELSDPSSAASQAVATSFLDAMRLPEVANVQVVHAELMRSVTHERRLQQSIAADIEITGVSVNDIDTLDTALESGVAANTMSAHLEQNLQQVEGIDIGSVQGVSMRPLPTDLEILRGDVPDVQRQSITLGNYTGFLPPENAGCAQWDYWFVAVLALRVLL